MGRFAQLAALHVCLVLIPTAVYAQGSITGVVRDTSGAVLPGVTVEAASPALIERVRSVVTDGTGQYRIENLRPGLYTVTFTLPGFAVWRREGIELSGSFVATVNADLRVGAVEETVTVTGETPIVDIQSVTRQRVIDHDVIDAIPTGRTERGLGVLIPGVTTGTQDVGGAIETAQVSLATHGSRSGDYRPTQNGVPLSIASGGGASFGGASNLAAYEQVAVDTAAVSAELATGGVRVNFIPKDGGNTFSGMVFGNFANEAMQSDNYTQDLKDRGLRTPNTIKRLVEINPAVGGPIKKDRLWFHTTVRRVGVANYAAGMFHNLNANNPNAWTYVPDPSRRPFNDLTFQDGQLRLTWQATAKNKLAFHWAQSTVCYCSNEITATVAPEAAIIRTFPRMRNLFADWTSPLTNRLLLEASVISRVEWVGRTIPPESSPLMVSVTDQGLGNLVYRAPAGTIRDTLYKTRYYRGATSYITGAHAFKVGFIIGTQLDAEATGHGTQPLRFRFNNGVPNQITLFATPHDLTFNMDADSGVYAQDKWTLGRLTLSYGLRYDYYKTSFTNQRLWPGPLVPNRDVLLPDVPGIAWSDMTPKSGASYDLFGTGKTALKVSLNKYVQGQASGGIFGDTMAPVSRVVNSTTRSWNDSNRNFVPDCDLTSTAANGECGGMANRNFGTAVPGATYDPETLNGWGKRPYNWEVSTGVQHEIAPRVSAEVSYFRRWYGNFVVTDDRVVAPTDYDPFSITAPAHPDLPGGGGYVIGGLYNLKPSKFGVPADNYITYANNYGKQIEHWNGIDVTVNARPRSGVLLQGGLSTGRTRTDNCEVVAKLPESNISGSTLTPQPYCHNVTAFLTQVKFLGTYTIPRVDVQVSGTFQSVPGPQILANYNAPNAVVAPSLGRPLSGTAANVTVNLVEPGTMYGERVNQLDLRVGKILRFGRTRAIASLDVFNALNSSTVLTQNNTFGGSTRWQQPQSVLLARFVKVNLQFDF